jgi:Sec-independent protein translocase protein TatA
MFLVSTDRCHLSLGLVRRIPSGVIGGAVVGGISLLLIILLLLVFFFCLENTDTDARSSGQGASAGRDHQKTRQQQRQHRQFNQERTTSHEITIISGNQRSDQQAQRQAHPHHSIEAERASMRTGLTDSANHGNTKQVPPSPLKKTATFAQLNQSQGSTTHSHQASPINSNTK